MKATAKFNRFMKDLAHVKGVITEETCTWVKTILLTEKRYDRVYAAVAFPIAKSVVPLLPDCWMFSGDVETSLRKDKRREQMLTVSSQGESFEANPEVKRLEFETSEYGKGQLYVGIKDAIVEVMALWYIDDNGNHVGKWFIDLFRFGSSQGCKVKIMHESIEWLFLNPLMTAILTGNFESQKNIRNSIEENIMFHCDDREMRKFLLKVADAMAVAYLHLFDKEAELAKPEQTTATGSNPEAPPPVRVRLFRPVPKTETHDITPAPAPEPEQVQAKAEEPAPMSPAEEPKSKPASNEVATESKPSDKPEIDTASPHKVKLIKKPRPRRLEMVPPLSDGQRDEKQKPAKPPQKGDLRSKRFREGGKDKRTAASGK